jgi:hypothetical protein
MVINGVLSDVTRVSTEVTDEVIVTAVEAGESARKVVQLLMLFFACVAGFFLMTLVSTALRSIWGAVQSAHIRWKCSQYWWQRRWPAIEQSKDDDGQERRENRPRATSQLADQENGDSENPKSPRPTRRSSEASSWSSPEGGLGSSSEAHSLAAIRRINQLVSGPRAPPLREGSSPSGSPPLYMES